MHKNAASWIEQILEATSHKVAAIWPPASLKLSKSVKQDGHCWKSKDELISNVLLWTPSHGRASIGPPAYLQQLYVDTGCSQEDLQDVKDNQDNWQKRVRKIHASSTTWWWWWCVYIYICKLKYVYLGSISPLRHIWLNNIDIFLSTYFCIYPFKLLYWCYGIWPELVNKPSMINWFPITFGLVKGHYLEICV